MGGNKISSLIRTIKTYFFKWHLKFFATYSVPRPGHKIRGTNHDFTAIRVYFMTAAHRINLTFVTEVTVVKFSVGNIARFAIKLNSLELPVRTFVPQLFKYVTDHSITAIVQANYKLIQYVSSFRTKVSLAL